MSPCEEKHWKMTPGERNTVGPAAELSQAVPSCAADQTLPAEAAGTVYLAGQAVMCSVASWSEEAVRAGFFSQT